MTQVAPSQFTPAVAPRRDSQCPAGPPPARPSVCPSICLSHLAPQARPRAGAHPPAYLGEQRGPFQRGLHQLVQGLEEPLQRALELSRLLPLVEPATARVTPCHHAAPGAPLHAAGHGSQLGPSAAPAVGGTQKQPELKTAICSSAGRICTARTYPRVYT